MSTYSIARAETAAGRKLSSCHRLARLAAVSGAALLAASLFGSPAGAEDLSIVGTGDGMAMLQLVGEAFTKSAPDVKVAIPESIGSGGAIKAVGTGEQKIGRVAREISEKEKAYNLTYVPVAKIPVVFFVNKGTNVPSLTPAQAADIYSGKVTNWKDVGGTDARIRVVRREDGDSSLGQLRAQLAEFKGLEITGQSKTALSTSENVEVVEKAENTIGFGPYSSALAKQVAVVKLAGKAPLDAGYPVFVTLGLIYKEETKTPTVQKFVDFAKTPAAHSAIKAADAVPF